MTLTGLRRLFVATAGLAMLYGAATPTLEAQAFLEAGAPAAPPQGAFALCAEDRETCGLVDSGGGQDAGDPGRGAVTAGRGDDDETLRVKAVMRERQEPWIIAIPAKFRPAQPVFSPQANLELGHGRDSTGVDDDQLMALARVINARINATMRYQSDQVIWGVEERWVRPLARYSSRYGDCEDFALEKRAALLEAGVPAERLRMAVGWSRSTGIHAVLIVRTEAGDFVLDNAQRTVRRVDETGYQWRSVQSGSHLLSWASAAVRTGQDALAS